MGLLGASKSEILTPVACSLSSSTLPWTFSVDFSPRIDSLAVTFTSVMSVRTVAAEPSVFNSGLYIQPCLLPTMDRVASVP